MVKEKRELRPGDKIIAKGETAVIGKVLFQDFYVDKLYYQLGEKGPDNSYVDIEFLDKKGHYRHYRMSGFILANMLQIRSAGEEVFCCMTPWTKQHICLQERSCSPVSKNTAKNTTVRTTRILSV